MFRKIGWIKKLQWINKGEIYDAGQANPFYLIPDNTQYGVVGYVAGESGEISGQPFPYSNSVVQIIADDESTGFITFRFSGDAYNLLAGTTLKVDGVEYAPYDEPNYDEGENVTDMAYTLPDSLGVFTAGVSYLIEFVRPA